MADYPHLLVETTADGVRTITLDRADKLNAVNGALAASRRSDFVPMLPRVSSYAYVAIGSNTTGWLRYDGGLDEVATLVGSAFIGAESEHLLGFEKKGIPIRKSLRRFGDLIRMMEAVHRK